MGNEYGVSPLTLLQVLSPAMFIAPILVWLVVVGPLFIYPVARWKANREPYVDPQLGLKVALHYFRLLAFQVVLLGALVVLYALISKGQDKGEIYRAGFGFLVPGGVVLGIHVAFAQKTNEAGFPTVRRLFLGYNLLVTGLVGFTSFVLACQALFAKGSSGDTGRLFIAGLLVYGGGWAACGFQFARAVFGDFPSAGAANMPPPPPPGPPAPSSMQGPMQGPPPPVQPSGPTLPALGGGSYPPIEPK